MQRILHRAGTTRIRERAQRCASWTGPPSRARGDLVVDALDGVAEARVREREKGRGERKREEREREREREIERKRGREEERKR